MFLDGDRGNAQDMVLYWPQDMAELKPESTEGGRRGSVLKWPEGAPVLLG